ncbi:MAG: sulfurtransferase [Deltaproteobacteria bacterium]
MALVLWVEDHVNDNNVRIAEVDYDLKANYHLGHIPNAVLFDCKKDINDPNTRNIISRDDCTALLQKAGINNDTILILYDDFNNWFAAFAFWESTSQMREICACNREVHWIIS